MSERQTRGLSSKTHIKLPKSRVLRNFANFLSTFLSNKERMVEIIFSTLQKKDKNFELIEDQPAYYLKTKSLQIHHTVSC